MLWIYISKNLFALELKISEFLEKFRDKQVLHLKRVNFETVQNKLTQVGLFQEFTHFIFEEYTGSFSDIESLFQRVNIDSVILITKAVEHKIFFPWSLIEKLEDRNYYLNRPSYKAKEKYLSLLIRKEHLKLPQKIVDIIKSEGLNSCIQIRGIISQLKILLASDKFKLTENSIRKIISSNNVILNLDEKYLFLEWYLTGKVKEWYLFLKKIEKSNAHLMEFLKAFSSSLAYNFWNDRQDPETLQFIRELGYNFFIFMETEFFKIKRDSIWPVTYFFWKHRPSRPIFWT